MTIFGKAARRGSSRLAMALAILLSCAASVISADLGGAGAGGHHTLEPLLEPAGCDVRVDAMTDP